MRTLSRLLARLSPGGTRLFGDEVEGLGGHVLVRLGILRRGECPATWACTACEERCGEEVREPYKSGDGWAVTCAQSRHSVQVASRDVAQTWIFDEKKMAEVLNDLLHGEGASCEKPGLWRIAGRLVAFYGEHDNAAPLAEVVAISKDGKLAAHIGKEHKTASEKDEIIRAVKKGFDEMRRDYKRYLEGDEGKADKRPARQRRHITRAVELFIKRHDIEGSEAASLRWCCKQLWHEAQEAFDDFRQFYNFTNYDYNRFYDLEAMKAILTAKEKQ